MIYFKNTSSDMEQILLINHKQLKRIEDIIKVSLFETTSEHNSTCDELSCSFRKDILTNLYYLNLAYINLDKCSKHMIKDINPRLFGFHDSEGESPYDRMVALTWFALKDDIRSEIIDNNNYDLFWKKFIDFTSTVADSFQLEATVFNFSENMDETQIEKDIFEYFSKLGKNTEKETYNVNILQKDQWDSTKPFAETKSFTITFNRIDFTNIFFTALEAKLADKSLTTGIDEIRVLLQDFLCKQKQAQVENHEFFTIKQAASYCSVEVSTI